MATINAQSIINQLHAAAQVAPEYCPHQAHAAEVAAILGATVYRAPYGYTAMECGIVAPGQFNATQEAKDAYTVANAARCAAVSAMVATAKSEAAAALVAPTVARFVEVATGARGRLRVRNLRARLQDVAAQVKRNAAAFGGGLDKPARAARPAAVVQYSAPALRLAREYLAEKNWGAALEVMRDKLGALFYVGRKCFAMMAPQDVPGLPGFVSAMNQDGDYIVTHAASGLAIDTASACKSRARAIAGAMAKWESVDAVQKARALQQAAAYTTTQAEALAKWAEERGVKLETQDAEAEAAATLAHLQEMASEAAQAAQDAAEVAPVAPVPQVEAAAPAAPALGAAEAAQVRAVRNMRGELEARAVVDLPGLPGRALHVGTYAVRGGVVSNFSVQKRGAGHWTFEIFGDFTQRKQYPGKRGTAKTLEDLQRQALAMVPGMLPAILAHYAAKDAKRAAQASEAAATLAHLQDVAAEATQDQDAAEVAAPVEAEALAEACAEVASEAAQAHQDAAPVVRAEVGQASSTPAPAAPAMGRAAALADAGRALLRLAMGTAPDSERHAAIVAAINGRTEDPAPVRAYLARFADVPGHSVGATLARQALAALDAATQAHQAEAAPAVAPVASDTPAPGADTAQGAAALPAQPGQDTPQAVADYSTPCKTSAPAGQASEAAQGDALHDTPQDLDAWALNLDFYNLDAATVQNWSAAQFRQAYDATENANHNTAALILAALRHGAVSIARRAASILQSQDREGALSWELSAKRAQLSAELRTIQAAHGAAVAPVASDTPAPAPKTGARRVLDNASKAGAQWCAVLEATPGGHALRFMGEGGAWEPTTTHATRRERAAALRTLVQKNADNVAGFDDTPEDEDGQEGTQDATKAPDYVGTGTYSPEDNKLRLHPFARLDAATYERVKAAGFAWAPKQGFFVAPMWTPARADLLAELCGDIGDEDSTLQQRAEERADRFSDYQGARSQEAARAVDQARAIGARFEFGQPILIGHHSERRARKDKERMDGAMRQAVRLWDTAEYWQRRAAAAVRHAAYKERPDVRARRIRTIEADQRKQQRTHDEAAKLHRFYTNPETATITTRDGRNMRAALLQSWEGGLSYEDARRLERGELDQAEALAMATRAKAATMAHARRWIDHYKNRIAYERAMLAEAGGLVAEKQTIEVGGLVKVRGQWVKVLRLNKKGGELVSVTTNGRFVSVRGLDEIDDYQAPSAEDAAATVAAMKKPTLCNYPSKAFISITKKQWEDCPSNYKTTTARIQASDTHGAHRVRKMIGCYTGHAFADWNGRHAYHFVFITDAKRTDPPAPEAKPAPQAEAAQPGQDTHQAVADYSTPRKTSAPAGQADEAAQGDALHDTPQDLGDTVDAMRQALKGGGVRVAVAPQLFPTPHNLAARMVGLAGIRTGDTVLEPSAGTGRLLQAVQALHDDAPQVHAVELNQALGNALRADFPGVAVHSADFLEWTPPDDVKSFDVVLMNPPFVNGADMLHIARAWGMVKPGGRLVAICAGGPRQARTLRPLVEQHGGLWEPLPAGTFAESGTGVHSVLLAMTKPGEAPRDTEDKHSEASAGEKTDTPAKIDQAPKKSKPMPIAAIRRTIDALNWLRQDYGGHTEGEFMRARVPENMAERMAAVRALQIPARFARDIESARSALEYAQKTVDRWHRLHGHTPAPATPTPPAGGQDTPQAVADYSTPCKTSAPAGQASEAAQDGGLHDTPQDLGDAAHGWRKLPPVAVDLAAVLAKGAPAHGLVGMGVDYLGDCANHPAEGAIVSASQEPGGAVLVDVLTEDGQRHARLPGSVFTEGGRWRLNLKHHGAPYLAGLAIANAQNRSKMPPMTHTDTMTGAELQTLREACGLSRDELAELADVQPRSVKHWETRRGGVPADVQKLVQDLDGALQACATAMAERAHLEHLGRTQGTPLVLARYQVNADIPRATWGTVSATMQGAVIGRMRHLLAARGHAVRVVWHDPDQADPLQALAAQSRNHKGDQPPAA